MNSHLFSYRICHLILLASLLLKTDCAAFTTQQAIDHFSQAPPSSSEANPKEQQTSIQPSSATPLFDMVQIPSGCFDMGSEEDDPGSLDEKPKHKVCLDSFQISKYEVTQAQWMIVMRKNPSRFIGDKNPVEQVSWADIQTFIKKLNALGTAKYRLPTEAEWEYAARSGGKDEKWSGTNNESELGEYCVYHKNSEGKTSPVGTRKPNGIGIFDMCGNVSEWVQDPYSDTWYMQSPRVNPQGPANGSDHVHRGGSWNDSPRSIRTSKRAWKTPNKQGTIGFRLVLPVE